MINTVIQGDCLEVMKRIEDKSVDLVVTDPPYAISLKGVTHIRQKGKGSKRLDFFHNCSLLIPNPSFLVTIKT